MKRQDLLAHLAALGCALKRSSIPRHSEINNHLAKKICRDLGVTEPARF